MRTWTLSPNRVNFATSPTSTSTLPGGVSGQYRVSNGAYDANGNLLFYVKDRVVYKSDGTQLGILNFYTNPSTTCGGQNSQYSIIQKEIAIVPVPGSCKKFYIIWLGMNFCNSGVAVRTAVVNLEVSPITLTENEPTNSYNDFLPGNISAGLAVGQKYDTDGNRILYVITNSGYNFYYVMSSGIFKNSGTIKPFTGMGYPSSIYPTEVDLSPDGTKIAWGSSGSNIVINAAIDGVKAIQLDLNSFRKTTINNYNAVYGVEFGTDGNLYANAYTSSTAGALIKITSPSSINATPNVVSTDPSFALSHLEYAFDGKLYAINNNGKLVAINTSVNPVTTALAFTGITVQSNSAVGSTDIFYSLQDQVDGENYQSFFAKQPITYTDLYPTNNGVQVPLTSGAYNVYNCTPISLTPVTTNATSYKLSIQSANSSGVVTVGTGSYSYIENWTAGSFPNTYDLRAKDNNYLMTHTGYYLFTLELADGCTPVTPKTALMNISTLTAASSNFTFNYGDGSTIAIPVNQTYSNPISTGQAYVGINATNSTGYLDSYTMKLEKINSSGAVTEVVCNNPAPTLIPSKNSSNLGSIALNGYIFNKCGKSNFYLTQTGNTSLVYRLTFTVNNACGSSSKVGYFTNVDPNYRKGDVESSEEVHFESETESIAFPNPEENDLTITYNLSEAQLVNISIVNAEGQVVSQVVKESFKPSGNNQEKVNIEDLQNGFYYYHIVGNKSTIGKFIKTKK